MKCRYCSLPVQVHMGHPQDLEYHNVCYYRLMKKLKEEYAEIALQTHQKNMVNNYQIYGETIYHN
jgi:hypothetical protein